MMIYYIDITNRTRKTRIGWLRLYLSIFITFEYLNLHPPFPFKVYPLRRYLLSVVIQLDHSLLVRIVCRLMPLT